MTISSAATNAENRAKTQQELFWEGDFGDQYTDRNQIDLNDRKPFFSRILEKTGRINSVCEFGANKGHNLQVLQAIQPALSLTGIEINPTAFQTLSTVEGLNAVNASIQDFNPEQAFDLVYTCGVLIHLNPADLPLAYEKMYKASGRYILINEYFNPVPVELGYRGHDEKLFKRDFAGEFLDQFGGDKVRVVDYGFLWSRLEPTWDDTTWVLIEKIA